MIRSHFGLQRNPFGPEAVTLLAHRQEVFDILRVHAQQGGLCLVLQSLSLSINEEIPLPCHLLGAALTPGSRNR